MEAETISTKTTFRPGVKAAIINAIDIADAQIIMNEVLLETLEDMDIKGSQADQITARKQQVTQEIQFNKKYLEALKEKFKDILE